MSSLRPTRLTPTPNCKAAGPSGIIAEMLKAAGEEGVGLVRKVAEAHGSYRGVKLTDQVMKLLEWVLDSSIYQMVNINGMQFTFMPSIGTTDAIFIARRLQEKYIAGANKQLYFAFVYLEKAFDRVPRKVRWWALRSLGVDEWAVRVIQGMYHNARSRVRVTDQYSEEFGMGVGMHQGSVLSPLLFILVL